MKKLTEDEKRLLLSLETCAERMQHMQAVLEMIGEDFECGACTCIRADRRLRMAYVMESAAHLAAYYHDEAIRVVDTYYGCQGG